MKQNVRFVANYSIPTDIGYTNTKEKGIVLTLAGEQLVAGNQKCTKLIMEMMKMNDKLSEEYRESIKGSINAIREFTEAIEKEVEKDMAYKSYIHEKIEGIEWRARMIKSICEEDE